MPDPNLINYYSVLNLPPDADLVGIENAYARLSDELAVRLDLDETSGDALRKLNEAYSILSKPELRREYDSVLFVREREEVAGRARAEERHRRMLQHLLIGALVAIVVAEAVGLVYLAREQLGFLAAFAASFT